MAGHSKWANIKRQKARVDAQKGQVFAKVSREIIVAARRGLPDPEANFQLRGAIEKAKAAGIPNENIDRAIAKGAGKLGADGSEIEAIRYEGYGPGGVAILIEAFTDNRNRTAADLRAAFNKYGGNLGETGCVSWIFTQKGVVTITGPIEEEALLEVLLDSGAESYELLEVEGEARVEIFAGLVGLEKLGQILRSKGYSVLSLESRWISNNTVEVSNPDQARMLLKLVDTLDDLDDIQTVAANFDMADDLLALNIA